MPRRKVLSELERAEVRHRYLLEKRDARNAEASALRTERDLLNAKKAEIREALRPLLAARDALVAEVQLHKGRRNELQTQAKELIALRRRLRGRLRGDVEDELRRLRDNVARLERDQETRSLSLEEENRLLEALRQAREELADLERLRDEHRDLLAEVGEVDAAIDDRFRRADAEHEAVVAKSQEVEAVLERMDEQRETLRLLDAESNRLHQAFLRARERADHYHRRAVAMREEILAIRQAGQAEDAEGRELLGAQREAARDALESDEEWEEAVEAALTHLRRGGRLEL